MNIGIYGGSFNPIHNGHIALAESFLQQAMLDEVWFMVSPQNPFKINDKLLDDKLRLQLVRKVLEGYQHFVASDYEFQLPKPSYTWDTLQSLSRSFPTHQFTLLIGGDNWASFHKWYHAEDLLTHYNIAIFPRKGTEKLSTVRGTSLKADKSSVYTAEGSSHTAGTSSHTAERSSHAAETPLNTNETPLNILQCKPKHITFLDAPLINISSTEIRNRIAQGLNIDHLVPKNIVKDVERYYR